MGNLRCKWVRDRLPLLASDDLRGLDRRRVERHLIGCPHCREHQIGLGQALETLRTVAAASPTRAEAPSLWPALARQIRESRHSVPAPLFPFAWAFAWPRVRFGAALGLGLGLLATIGVSLSVRNEIAAAKMHIDANEQPLAEAFRPQPPESQDTKPGRDFPRPLDLPVAENPPPPPRLDREYDLDHGRPMPPDVRDPRDSKATY